MQLCPGLGQPVRLRSLLPDARWTGVDDVGITGCARDSRRVRPGDLFVALVDDGQDGHAYIAEAVRRGCAAVLTDRPPAGFFAGSGDAVPYCIVPNAREAFGHVCHALAGNPSRALKLIGVTGANGKTTTSCLIAGILTAAGHCTGVVSKLGYLDGAKVEEAACATPPPERLAALLSRMVGNGCTHAVMEVSDRALDQSRVAGAWLDAACITNVARDHLDVHGLIRETPPSRADFQAVKSTLFDHLTGEGFTVLNADDPGSAAYLHWLDGPALTVGIHSPAEITATPIEQSTSQQTFLLTAGMETVPVQTRMIGVHHIYNCLTAAAVGLTYGIDLTTVVRGLESVDYVPGRLQRIECGQPFGVFVDSARTPEALTGALKCLRTVTSGRILCVFGAVGQRSHERRPLLGRAAEQGADVAILTSNHPRHEDIQAIFKDVVAGFQSPDRVQVVADRAMAIHQALAAARPGDCVLIAGKGHQRHEIVGDARLPFDDAETARQWLYANSELATADRRPSAPRRGGFGEN